MVNPVAKMLGGKGKYHEESKAHEKKETKGWEKFEEAHEEKNCKHKKKW